MRPCLRLVVPCLLILLLAGCGSPHHRKVGDECAVSRPADPAGDWEPENGTCRDRWAVRTPSHGVNYVEIDEQGILHDRAAAEAAIRYAAAPPTAGNRMAYVVVFIHGWHHSAEAGDSNVQAFHRALAAVKHWRRDADVRGIYIGWRGSSLDIPLLRYLTFWERKNTSDEIGRGALLEFLLRLERGVKPEPASTNRLVLIGHSFGASVAFNALAHVHMQRFVDGLHSTAPGPRFRGYGDLTVLINPAIEAMRYMPLQSAVEYYASPQSPVPLDFSQETKPRLVILASDGDLATRCTFPVARLFSTALEAHNRISPQKSPDPDGAYVQWNMDRDTVGNFPNFRTHWPLRLVDTTTESRPPSTFVECLREIVAGVARPAEPPPTMLDQCATPTPEHLRELLRQEAADPDAVTAEPQPALPAGKTVRGSYFPDSNIRVVRMPLDSRPKLRNSPYIVAGVGTEIIASHSGIGNPNLICWINQLVDGP